MSGSFRSSLIVAAMVVLAGSLQAQLTGPDVAKSFTPASVPAGTPSTMTITLINPNLSAITGVAFTDTFPAGLVNATPPSPATTCSPGTVTAVAGGGSVALSGGTIPGSGSCTVTVMVTSVTPATYTNTLGGSAVTSSNAQANESGVSATLTVAGLAAPGVTKSFTPPSILIGGFSTITVTLSNPNGAAITGAAFTDTFPANLFNAVTPNAATTCGGTVTAAPGGGTLALAGGTIPAIGTCTVTVVVTSNLAGMFTNTIPAGAVTAANAPPNTAAASAALAALAAGGAPTLSPSMLLLLALGIVGAGVLLLRR